jgi:MFS family permease
VTTTTETPVVTPDPRAMRRVATTALAGASIEWYDFFLYGTAAALIFPTAFFPDTMPLVVAQIASFSTFAVGFFARPLGGVIFGHFGDQRGRKRALVIALMMMGLASTLIGLLPTYAVIGAAAPIALIVLRFIQGLAIGGQWGGAILLVTENSPPEKRGFYGAFAQAGAPVGMILANLAFLGVSAALPENDFMAWGWRIPFVASALLIIISIYVQLRLEETPAFKKLEAAKIAKQKVEGGPPKKERSPILEVFRLHPDRVFLAAGAFLSIQVFFYILAAFVLTYGTSPDGLGLSRNTLLTAVLIGSIIQIPVQFWAASFSDRHGRRGIFMAGAVLSGLWAFALFPLLATGNFALILLGVTVGLCVVALQYGPQAAFFSELFSTKVRYSGASLGYQIGAILGGAMAPIVAVLLWTNFGIVFVSIYIAAASVLTLISVLLLLETKGLDMHAEPDADT